MHIIASDFDRTLYVEDENILNMNIKSIDKFISKGNTFIIITGRMYTDIKLLLDKYKINYTFLICEDGAKIFNEFDYSIKDYLLPKEKIDQIEEIFKEYNEDYYLDDGYNITTNKNDCVKVTSLIKDRKKSKEIVERIKKDVDVYVYLSKSYINITDSSTSKSIALEYLMYYKDLYKEDLYVLGDDINDYEMLSNFKGGVMKHHSKALDELKKEEFDTLYDFIDYVENK